MESVKIKYVGKFNTIFNVVSKEMFENEYKSKGWVLASDEVKTTDEKAESEDNKKEQQEEVSKTDEVKTTDEQTIKNIETMKKNSIEKKFNDKIIKE